MMDAATGYVIIFGSGVLGVALLLAWNWYKADQYETKVRACLFRLGSSVGSQTLASIYYRDGVTPETAAKLIDYRMGSIKSQPALL